MNFSFCKCTPGHYARARRYELCSYVSLLVTVAGILLATVAHDELVSYIEEQLENQFLITSPSSGTYPSFQDSTNPNAGQVYSNYWFYNITNPDAVLQGAAPEVVEIGPVRYLYYNTKYNISWENDGEIVSYKEYQRYFPADEATRVLQDQVITTINVLLLAALNSNSGFSSLVPFLPKFWDHNALFTQRTIADMLWGYTDSDLAGFKFPGLQPNDTSADYALSQHSTIRVNTGKFDKNSAWDYVEWDGMDSLQCCKNGPQGETGSPASGQCVPAWNTFDAGMIHGSSGSNWHLNIDPSETLYIATYDFGILRTWPLECSNVGNGPGAGFFYDASPLTANIGGCDSYDKDGISVLKFALPTWVLGNASVDYIEAQGYGIQGPSGILNQTLCETYAPIFLSRPHFLHGSDQLLNGIKGLTPGDPSIHDSWIGIEPVTGQVLDFQFRIGINAFVEPTSVVDVLNTTITYFPNVTSVYVPLGWGEQRSGATPNQANQFKSQVYFGLKILAAFRWGGVSLAVVGLILAAMYRYWSRKEHKYFQASVGQSLIDQDIAENGQTMDTRVNNDVLLYDAPRVDASGSSNYLSSWMTRDTKPDNKLNERLLN